MANSLEIIVPGAVRTPDGTEYYKSAREAGIAFVVPSEEINFRKKLVGESPSNYQIMLRHREKFQKREPVPAPNSRYPLVKVITIL